MATSAAADQIVDVVTPAAGESVTEGTILEWHAKVGEAIKRDETIVEISTDKVDVELPAPAGTPEASATTPGNVKVSPVAARAAAAEGVDLAQLAGSGPAGRIVKSDV